MQCLLFNKIKIKTPSQILLLSITDFLYSRVQKYIVRQHQLPQSGGFGIKIAVRYIFAIYYI